MGLFNLPILGNSLLFPTILTSLIVGFMFLILAERKRVKGGSASAGSRGDARTTAKEAKEGEGKEDGGADGEAGGAGGQGEEAKGESSSCSSGSEEELGEKKKAKSKKAKKKHSCEGAKACSSKKTVSEVTLWTGEGQQNQVFGGGTFFSRVRISSSFILRFFTSSLSNYLFFVSPLSSHFSISLHTHFPSLPLTFSLPFSFIISVFSPYLYLCTPHERDICARTHKHRYLLYKFYVRFF